MLSAAPGDAAGAPAGGPGAADEEPGGHVAYEDPLDYHSGRTLRRIHIPPQTPPHTGAVARATRDARHQDPRQDPGSGAADTATTEALLDYLQRPASPPHTENEWLGDYVLQFLKSPSWAVPVMQFIDENCMVFDDEEENKLEFTELHNKFKQLVDSLLAAHLLEIGITAE